MRRFLVPSSRHPVVPVNSVTLVIAVIPANAGIHFLSTAKSALTETFKPALFAADSVGKSAL